MLELLTETIQTTLNSFDITYCILVNLVTYFVNKLLLEYKGDIGIWTKRLVLICAIIILGIIYYFLGKNVELILNSAILAPVAWSWIIKPICQRFGIDYRKSGKNIKVKIKKEKDE